MARSPISTLNKVISKGTKDAEKSVARVEALMEEIVEHENELTRAMVAMYKCLVIAFPEKKAQFETACASCKVDMNIEGDEE